MAVRDVAHVGCRGRDLHRAGHRQGYLYRFKIFRVREAAIDHTSYGHPKEQQHLLTKQT
jgi:hypothetical protein